jgi:hypothetical protein
MERVLCLLSLLAVPLCVVGVEAAVDDSVVLLQEHPRQPVYPYDKWAAQAEKLEKGFPPLPADPESSNAQANLVSWSLKNGLGGDLLRAKGEYAAHQQKVAEENAELQRDKEIDTMETKVLEKAVVDHGMRENSLQQDSNADHEPDAEGRMASLKLQKRMEAEDRRKAEEKQKDNQAQEMLEAIKDMSGEPTALLQVDAEPETTVHVKEGSALHKAQTTVRVKEGSALHTRYYAKKEDVLHKNDPAYDNAEQLKEEAETQVEIIASAAIRDSGLMESSKDEGFEQFKEAAIAAAVAAAAPKVAELNAKSKSR